MAKINSKSLAIKGQHVIDPGNRRHRELIGRSVAVVRILESREVDHTITDDKTGLPKKVKRRIPVKLQDRQCGKEYIMSGASARHMVKAGVAEMVKEPGTWEKFDGKTISGHKPNLDRALPGKGKG